MIPAWSAVEAHVGDLTPMQTVALDPAAHDIGKQQTFAGSFLRIFQIDYLELGVRPNSGLL
jgi:hypothetical protein